MKKRLLSAFMALALCLTLLPAPALAAETAETNVAEVTIGSTTTQYTNIVDAFANAQKAESAAVKLLETVTIPKNKSGYSYGIQLTSGNITLDLNGHTIQTTGGASSFVPLNAVFYISGGGSLTVQDSGTGGKIEQPNAGQAIGVSYGNLTVKNGTIEVTSTATDQDSDATQNCAVFVRSSGVADIQGGTLIGNRGIYIGGKLGGGTLTVSGAPQIQGRNSYALQVVGGTVTLSGGTYTGAEPYSIWNADGTAGNLLASGCRYQDDNGKESAYGDGNKGVVGNTTVAERPANEFPYVDARGKEQTQANCTELTAAGFQGAQADTTTWFAANTSFTADNPLQVVGTVNLILCDGVTVTLNKGIALNGQYTKPATLNIYAQSGGTGTLICSGPSDSGYAGIYDNSNEDGNETALNIYGGVITATGTSNPLALSSTLCGAGIGSIGNYKYKSTMAVNIFGGTVTAKSGGKGAHAIGNGTYAKGTVAVTIAPGMKRVKTDDLNTACDPGNTDGTSVTVTKCENHVWEYTYTEDTHTKTCTLCHTVGESEAHSPVKYVSVSETQHDIYCVCGKKLGTEEHAMQYNPNPNGLTHKISCEKCNLTPVDQPHTFQVSQDSQDIACTACQIRKAAEYNGQQYASLQAAINAAAADGGTVKLAQNVSENVTVAGGTVTVDLNGKQWSASISEAPNLWGLIPLTVTGGSVTLENGTLDQGHTSSMGNYGIRIQGGSVTVKGTAVVIGSNTTGSAANISYPAIILESGGALTLATGATLVYGLKVPEGKHLSDYLPAGTAFGLRSYDEATKTWTVDKGLLNAYTINNYAEHDMTLVVVEHTQHNFVQNEDGEYVCACGYTCPHNDFKDGKCTICGNGCAHTDVDDGGVCRNCKAQMAAKVEVGGKMTYTTDLGTTLHNAANGATITLLANAAVGNVVLEDKTVTLDLNGKTVKNSGGGSNRIQIGSSRSSASLIITGRGSFISVNQVLVVENGTLDLSRWTGDDSYIRNVTISGANSRFISPNGAGKINTLAFTGSDTEQAADTASLNGGRYDEIAYERGKTIKLGDLLAEGYAFRQNGTFLEYASKLESNDTIKKVEVVKCPHADAEGGKCLYCGKTGILARVGDTTYGSVSDAVAAWMNASGTLTLYADYGQGADGNDLDLISATAEWLAIDLNGHGFYKDCQGDIKLGGGKRLTITDSKEKTGSQGAFGPIIADRGTLTLESGHLQSLRVPSSSSATILLKGGKLTGISCPVPIFNLLPNGYALMADSGLPVDPTITIDDSKTYTVKDSTNLYISSQNEGSAAIGSDTIPFALSLETNDKDIGQMGFEWYIVKEDGTTQKLAATTSDVTPGTNGVYTCNAANMTVDPNGWSGLEAKQNYDVLCVVTGKAHDGTPKWKVPMRGYKLTVTPADLSQGAVVFTQVADEFFGAMGNINDGKGTFVFTPYIGNAASPTELSYLFEVSCNGRKLTAGSDYTVKGGNTAKWAGTYTLTIEGKGNYTGTAAHQWEIKPYTLSKDLGVARIIRNYDGTTNLSAEKLIGLGCFSENIENRNSKNPILCADENGCTIQLGAEDFEVSNVKLGSAEAGDTTASFTIRLKPRSGQTAANFVFEDGTSEMTVEGVRVSTAKAHLSSSPEAGELNVANNHAGVYTLDLSALLPKLESPKEYGKVTYALDAIALASDYYAVGTARIENGKLILPIQAVETRTESNIGTVKVKVTSGNIVDFTLPINVNATNKIVPTGEPTLSAQALTYGQALSAIKLSGKLHDNVNNKDIEGMFTWVDGTVKPGAGSYGAAWKFTPADGDTYTEADGTVTITVNKAKPTGTPKYTPITSSGKKLSDAKLTAPDGTFSVPGTIQWVDKDGKELPETTEVKANTAYKWVFTPSAENAANYTTVEGTVTLYSVSTGGGGGGGSSSSTTTKTDTVTNPDGSTTKTETKSDGTVVATTTGKDGSVSKTETKKDGSSVTENKTPDGSTGTVKTDKNGQTTAETKVSEKAIEDAKKNGEAVKAPVEVEASRNSSTAPTVKVELPKGAGETKVEIPVSNVKPGTVAVLVHPDGTEEIVKNSLPTEDGIQLTVNGNATVKIVDNSKDFIDTRNHWAKDAIDFVSARGLVNGMNAVSYAPNASTTRAQLWTILARQNDADLSGGATWFENAQNWAKEKGISDGANPNGTINRAQMVTMLWRAVGQPAVGGTANFADVPADSYYAQAVAWAVENGITTGVGGGRFDPTATCTRGQIATFLYRLYLSR